MQNLSSPFGASDDSSPAGFFSPAGDDAALCLLDDVDEWLEFSRELVDRSDDASGVRVWESNVVFEGMHCAACASTIEQALRGHAGVLEADVSAAAQRGRVVWRDDVSKPSGWISAVRGTGYGCLPAHNAFGTLERQAQTRKMMWRLGVAGMCMMQVMMYATPTYFTAAGDIEPQFVNLLRWAQWVLSVPVMLFSCQPFFSNALRDLKTRSISMDLPVSLAMLITFIVSSLGTFEPDGLFGHEVYFDSLTMFVFFLLGGRWLELRLRDKTAGALEALMHRLPDSVLRKDDVDGFTRVSTRRVRSGDVIRVLPSESFCADGVILSGATLVDEALLTGESKPIVRGQGDFVVAGSHNLGAPVDVRVSEVGGQTRYSQIVSLMSQASVSKPAAAQLADRLAKPFLAGVLFASAAVCAWWWNTDPAHALMVTVAVLVVTCPCALSLATPAAMLAGAGSLARRGVLVRRLQALEDLSHVNTWFFDKTGTLTNDSFELAGIRSFGGFDEKRAFALAAMLAKSSLHPISRSLVAHFKKADFDAVDLPNVVSIEEIAGSGLLAKLEDGGILRFGSAGFCDFDAAEVDGKKSGQVVSYLADTSGVIACFVFNEYLRPDAAQTISALQSRGMRIELLSGDKDLAAMAVGEKLGLDFAKGGFTPRGKLEAMQAAQSSGKMVAMVGDGLNDAPVIAGANVSFAFGQAVPIARAGADFVVLGNRLDDLKIAYEKSVNTLKIVRQNLTWSLIYNIIGIPLAIAGYMPAWAAGLGMACSSLLVVGNAFRLAK